MIFANHEINLDHFPKVEHLDYQKVAPAYLKVSLIGSALFLLFFLIIIGVFAAVYTYENHPFLTLILFLGWGGLAILVFFFSWKGYHLRAYAIRERDITYRKGVLFQTQTVVPFNRVQHCEISQGPVERWFNLKKLEIYTAGGSSSDLSIAGLDTELAPKLKDYIIKKTGLDASEEE